MKIIINLIMPVILLSFAHAADETSEGRLKKCAGFLNRDGSVTYKEDCMSPLKTVVKKGIYPKVSSGPIDTPQKAMELYNKSKNETTVLSREDTDNSGQ